MKLLKLFMSLSLSCLLLCSCEKPYSEEDNVPDINTGENNKPSGGDNTPGGNSGTGKYSTGDVVTVQEFIDNEINCQVFVVGYIVGDCTKSISNAEFEPPFTQPQALLIADDMNEDNTDKVASIQLKSGSKWRQSLNLEDNPQLHRRKIMVFGFKERYLGVPGIKSIDAFEFI